MLRSGSLFLITLILADSAPHCGGSKDWSTLVLSLDDCSCRFEQVQIYVDNLLEAGGVTIRCGEPFRLRIETESGHHSLSIQSGDAVVFDTGIWTSGGQEQQVNLTCPVD